MEAFSVTGSCKVFPSDFEGMALWGLWLATSRNAGVLLPGRGATSLDMVSPCWKRPWIQKLLRYIASLEVVWPFIKLQSHIFLEVVWPFIRWSPLKSKVQMNENRKLKNSALLSTAMWVTRVTEHLAENMFWARIVQEEQCVQISLRSWSVILRWWGRCARLRGKGSCHPNQ